MWKLPDEAVLNTRIDQLPRIPAAHYSFLGSDLIRRHGCTPGTRLSILHQLRDWSYYDHNQKVYWLNGTVGTGKTTIAYTFCKELESTGKLAANFFCSRQLPACRDANQILPAISYQLSLLSRPTRSAVSDALEQNINIGELELSEQLERLVAGPLRMVKHTLPSELVIVIEALDECDDPKGVDRLLECLLERERDLPVKFLITSRPSANILQRIQSKSNEQSERELRLHEADRSIVASDIKTYLQAELEHLSHSVAEVEKLADQSGILFAYAAVLVDSIRHGSSGAVERLKKILDTCTSSEQYMIYATILQGIVGPSVLDNVKKGQMILVLRAVARADEPLSVNYLAKLLKFGTTDLLQTVLHPLWSVLQLSHEGEQVAIHHTSFSRYILDQHDLSGLHNSGQQYALQLALSCFDRMKEPNPPYNICKLPSSYLKDEEIPDLAERANKAISNDLLDSCLDWGTYMTLAGPSDEALNALDEFLSTRLLLWMEILNLKRRLSDGITSLGKIYQWLKLVRTN
ncbi:WD repeat-containing protein 38 [Ceratobasidium sp. 428]|nr:WD repeat-containing protein 38 [Ceratobasidium sp. 428]